MVAERKGAAAPNYILSDHLGSTSTIVDANGNNPKNTSYYSFGTYRTSATAGLTDRAFTGQINDASTGLYYFGARYYDPALGRWISPGPVVTRPGNPQALNRYSYVLNNPLKYHDPSGNDPEIVEFFMGMSDAAGDFASANFYTNAAATNFGERYDSSAYYSGRMATDALVTVGGTVYTYYELKGAYQEQQNQIDVGGGTVAAGQTSAVALVGPLIVGGGANALGKDASTYYSKRLAEGDGGDKYIRTGYKNALTGEEVPMRSSAGVKATEKFVEKHWDKGTFDNAMQSANYHLDEHGGGMTIQQYTQKGLDLYKGYRNTSYASVEFDAKRGQVIRIRVGDEKGIFTMDGKIIYYVPE